MHGLARSTVGREQLLLLLLLLLLAWQPWLGSLLLLLLLLLLLVWQPWLGSLLLLSAVLWDSGQRRRPRNRPHQGEWQLQGQRRGADCGDEGPRRWLADCLRLGDDRQCIQPGAGAAGVAQRGGGKRATCPAASLLLLLLVHTALVLLLLAKHPFQL